MIYLNTSLSIIALFFLLTLVVGIFFSRKKTTFREYAIGNKQFSTPTLVATVLATLYGAGGLLRNINETHQLGLWWILLSILDSFFCFWIISKLSLRMGPFMQHLSMAETIGHIYDRYPRIIAAFVGICGSIVGITIQISVISKALNISLGLHDHHVPTILATLLLIFYSSFGGVRAITYTDILQFITFAMIIPLLSWFIFVKTGKSIETIVPMLQAEPKFQFNSIFHCNRQSVSTLLLLLSFIISYINPSLMQRVYMAATPHASPESFFICYYF